MSPHPKQATRQSLAGVRLRKHADYQRAYAAARKRQSASMSWFLAPQPGQETGGPRVGLTAGKVLGKAHERNRIKRRMREALRRHVDLSEELVLNFASEFFRATVFIALLSAKEKFFIFAEI